MELPVKMEFPLGVKGTEVRDKADGGFQLRFDRAMLLAVLEVNNSRAIYRHSAEAVALLGDRFDTHPDVKNIHAWLEGRDVSLECEILYFLSAHVITEWDDVPKRTRKQHRIFNQISDQSKALRSLIEQTGSRYYRAGGHGLMDAFVGDLFTNAEANDVTLAAQAWHDSQPDSSSNPVNVSHCFPTIEELLGRLAEAAQRIADAGPIHSQPGKRGARTGYFVRRMAHFLTQRYGNAPAGILASIASVALNEVVDADLADKHLKLSERSTRKTVKNVP